MEGPCVDILAWMRLHQYPPVTTRLINQEALKWFQTPRAEATAVFECSGWGSRHCGTISAVPPLNFWPTESVSITKYLFHTTVFGMVCYTLVNKQNIASSNTAQKDDEEEKASHRRISRSTSLCLLCLERQMAGGQQPHKFLGSGWSPE